MNQITIDGKVYNLVPVEEEKKEGLKPTGWERKKRTGLLSIRFRRNCLF